MILKMCTRCHTIIDRNKRMCDKCLEKAERIEKNRMKQYDRERANNKEVKFYNSKEWKGTRFSVLDRDTYKCIVCYKKEKRIVKADAIHHIEEIKENWDRRVDKDNLICVCDTCHKNIHAAYNRDKQTKIKIQEQLFELLR